MKQAILLKNTIKKGLDGISGRIKAIIMSPGKYNYRNIQL